MEKINSNIYKTMAEIYNHQIEKCPLCGHTSQFRVKRKGYQEPDIFNIFHCPHCNTDFSMPRTNTNHIYDLIYKNAAITPNYSRYYTYRQEIKYKEKPLEYLANKESSYWSIFYSLTNILHTNLSAHILEVGSGLGYFTYSLQKFGFVNTRGLDISSEAVNTAKTTFGNYYVCDDIYQYAERNKNKYDVIILTEVIEHIEEPISFLKTLSSLLNSNGTILMTTPNKSSFPSKANWCTDKPPVHCWWFSEDSFQYIAQKISMTVAFVDFSPYFKKHPKNLYCLSLSEGKHVFDKNGDLIQQAKDIKNGIFPQWIKRTNLYQTISRYLYPKIFKNQIAIGGKKGHTLCAILKNIQSDK